MKVIDFDVLGSLDVIDVFEVVFVVENDVKDMVVKVQEFVIVLVIVIIMESNVNVKDIVMVIIQEIDIIEIIRNMINEIFV